MTKHNVPSNRPELFSKKQLEMAKVHPDEKMELSPEIKHKIGKIMEFFKEHELPYDQFDPEKNPKLNLKAYPNNDAYMYIPGQRDTQKWLQAVREIYFKEKDGSDRVKAIRQTTSGWNVMETFDFLNWLRFHEAGEHMKYKFAQLWYENQDAGPGYFLQIKPDPVKEPEPQVQGKDIDFARDEVEESMSKSEKKQIIEKQRDKIIGRLDSAEKLVRSPHGQIFSGKEFENLLEAIYQLKKKIQMVNKVSTSTRLYDDMIVREANVLNRNGFIKAADVLYSLAQTPGASGEQAKGDPKAPMNLPPATPPEMPTKPQGAPGGLPSMGPGMAQNPPESAPSQPPGIKEFLEGMDTAKVTSPDSNTIEDDLEVEDDTLNVVDGEDGLLVTEAQLAKPDDVPITDSPAPSKLDPSPIKAPIKEKSTVTPKGPATEEPLEVSEEDLKPAGEDAPAPVASNFDAKVDEVFANITIADVAAKLEDIAKFYKTREAPRQLAIVDMMLDSLGLASYFPSLAEATNKSLESNNYISTRVEDILSKLRGAIAGTNTDIKGEEAPERPEIAGIKNKLKSDEEKEKARKQMRKDQEAAELSGGGKETPEVEIAEDLGAPAAKTPPPARPVPPAV
jgi:hypothetical protein